MRQDDVVNSVAAELHTELRLGYSGNVSIQRDNRRWCVWFEALPDGLGELQDVGNVPSLQLGTTQKMCALSDDQLHTKIVNRYKRLRKLQLAPSN
jgi:hypothetical protein